MSTWNPKANEIFLQALELPTPGERERYLEGACLGDTALRGDVEALLHAGAQAGSFLESPAAPALLATVEQPIVERPGTLIGHYKLLEQIGEGGFGVVFMAEQTQPVRRKVALKVLKPGMDTRQVVARFEAERQALAIMDHPNIAKVHDGGATQSGRPYFVMELVKGVPITAFCDQNQLTPRERLELFIHVCQAVQHAHQKGIIHCDLKPSNILVVMHDTTPVVKVIDFGVAKALGQELTDKTLFTGFAQMVGTPLYMSPEQAGQSGLDVDTRSDIYSLGVLLYELLTGTTPVTKERFRAAGYDEIRRIIREEEPPKPSTRISTLGQAASTVSTNRKTDAKHLGRLLRGEVDWIVMKCLEKDRNRRYETANGLARDIERFLHDEPVQACPPSAWYRLRKFARRKKIALAMAACVFLALSGIAGGVGWAVRDKRARDDAGELDRLARERALDQVVERNLDETDPLIEEGRWPEALAIIARTEQLLDAAERSERSARLVELRKALAVVQRLEGIYQGPMRGGRPRRRTFSSPETTLLETQPREEAYDEAFFWGRRQDSDFKQAFLELGIDVETLSPAEAAEKIRRQSIRSALIRSLDGWATFRKRSHGELQWRNEANSDWKKLIEIARQADADELRNRSRDALLKSDRSALEELADAVPVRQTPPESLYLLGQALKEVGAVDKAMTFLERGRREYPGDLWLNDALANFSWSACRPPRWDAALRYYAAVLALRPDFSPTHLAVADALKAKGATDEALLEYSKAVELEPKSVIVWTIRGNFYRELRRYDEAIADYSKVTELEPNNGSVWRTLASLHRDAHRLDEAERVLLRTANLFQKAAKQFPDDAQWSCEEAETMEHLFLLLADCGRERDAEDFARQAIGLYEKVAGTSTHGVKARFGSGWCYAHLAEVHARTGRSEDARQDLKRSDDIFGQLAAEFPSEIEYERRPADIRLVVGPRFVQSGQLEEAVKVYGDAAVRYEKLAAGVAARENASLTPPTAGNDDAWLRHELGYALTWQGDLLRRLGRLNEAEAVLSRGLEVHEKLAAESPDVAERKTRVGWTLVALGDVHKAAGAYRKAEQNYLNAMDDLEKLGAEFPDNADCQSTLIGNYDAHVQLLTSAGDEQGAQEIYQRALRYYQTLVAAHQHDSSPRDGLARSQHNLAGLLHKVGKKKEAATAYREAIAIWEKLADDFPTKVEYRQHAAYSYGHLAGVLNNDGQPKEAIENLQQQVKAGQAIVAQSPERAEGRELLRSAYHSLGLTQRSHGQHEEAVVSLVQAAVGAEKLARDSPGNAWYFDRLHEAHGELAATFILARHCDEGEKFYGEAIKLQPSDAMLWFRRAEFYARLGLWDLAAKDSSVAFNLQPLPTALQCFAHALLSVSAGDLDSYREVCRLLPNRFPIYMGTATSEVALSHACAITTSAPADAFPWALQRAETGAKEPAARLWAHCGLGLMYFRAGDYERAIQQLEQSLAAGDWDASGSAYAALAMSYHHLGQEKKAEAALEQARRVIDRGLNVLARGPAGTQPASWWEDWLESYLLYREARALIDGSPPAEDPRFYVARALAFAALGDEKSASDSYAKAAEQVELLFAALEVAETPFEPSRPLTLINACRELAAILKDQGRVEDAKELCRHVAEVCRSTPETLDVRESSATYADLAYALESLARLLDELGETVEAEGCYREAAGVWEKLASEFPQSTAYGDAHCNMLEALANLYVKHGRLEEADRALTNAVEKCPNQPAAWRSRGELFARWCLFPESAADLTHAFGLQEPEDSVPFFVHALLRAYVGDGAGYRDACARMLARFENSTSAVDWNNVAAALSVSADSGVEPSRAVDFAQRAVGENRIVWRVAYLGMAYYRAGEFQHAAAALEESLAINVNYNPAWVYSALAMARHQLGDSAKAAAALVKAGSARDERLAAVLAHGLGEWPGGPWWDTVYAERLHQEAHTLVRGSPPPEDARWLVLRGRGLEAVGRAEAARAAFAEAFALAPNDLMIRIQALPPISRADAHAQALADLRAFWKEHPRQQPAAMLALAQVQQRWGDQQAHAGRWSVAAEAFLEAAAAYDNLLAQIVEHAESTTDVGVPATGKDIAWYRHELGFVVTFAGVALRKLDRLDEAETALARGLEIHASLVNDAEAPAGTKSRLAWTQVELGMVFQARGSPHEAEQKYREVIAILEAEGKAVYWLAGSYDALAQLCEVDGRTAEAIEAQRKAVAAWEQLASETKQPQHRFRQAWANERLAAMLLRANDSAAAMSAYGEAVEVLEALAREQPDRADHYFNCGLLRSAFASDLSTAGDHDFAQKEFHEAIADYTKVIELTPDNAVAHNNLAWLYATCPESELRDPTQAVALAKKAVELQPTEGSGWNTLGAAQYRTGDWPAAVESLTKSMELRSGGDAEDWYFLAMAHCRLGHVDDARKWHQRAVEWEEKNSAVLANNRQVADELRRFHTEAEEVLGKSP